MEAVCSDEHHKYQRVTRLRWKVRGGTAPPYEPTLSRTPAADSRH
jgi:hypothetical protein